MNLDGALREELATLEERGLRREIRALDPDRVDLVTNDYLGLGRDPRLAGAAARAALEHGAGGRAARLLGGGAPLSDRVERAAAEWLGAEAALVVPSGYQANLAVLVALAGPGDVIHSDRRNHASLIDGARLSRATVEVFDDLEQLAHHLRLHAGARRRLVVTEGVFSMDGDTPDLAGLAELCLRGGAHLVVDEAHAAGLLGPAGAGAWAAADAPPEALAARIVTGGKALGAAGGLVVASAAVREMVIHRGRSFVFTTAPPPSVLGALLAGIEAARQADEARERCLGRARGLARQLGLPTPAAAIVPVLVGDDAAAVAHAEALQGAGFELRAVRPPTVPPGTARLRVVTHAFNTTDQIANLAKALLARKLPAPGVAVTPPAPGRPIVVVGTDTGIGKTVVSAALLRALADAGPASYWKPVQTGDDDDTSTVEALSGVPCPRRPDFHFALPAAPHEAAQAEGDEVDVARLDQTLRALRAQPGAVVIELAGGLHVPLTGDVLQADWLARHRPEVVLVARSGLGTLNHTQLTLEALARRGLRPRALVLVGDPHPANRATLARRTGLEPYELPWLDPLTPEALQAWVVASELRP